MRLFFSLLMLPLIFMATPSLAEKRVALVIGNGAYESVPKLPNPKGDAKAIADVLGGLGFSVILRDDLDQQKMATALSDFAKALTDADAALFYYAGHAIQYDGHNYLISTNAKLDSPFALNSGAIPLDQIVATMQESSAINLVLLDACRNNPFVDRLKETLPAERSVTVARGLAPFSVQKGDTMVVYATAANQTAADGAGKHSPFTQALLDNLATPGVEVSLLLKRVVQEVREKTLYQQSPEVLSAMAAEFYFSTDASGANSVAGSRGVTDFDQVTAAYKQASASDTTEAWQGFLDTFPDAALATFAQDALIRAQARETQYDPSVTFEDGENELELGKEERLSIQTTLSALGYDVGTPDGVFGKKTRQAVLAFQVGAGLMPTGYVDAPTRAQFRNDSVQKEAARSFEAAQGLTGIAAERKLALTAGEIDIIKLGLASMRFPVDEASGVISSDTRAAIKQLQFKRDLKTDGYLTAELATELFRLGNREGGNLARFVDPDSLAAGVDPRLTAAVRRFVGKPIKYAYLGDTLYVAVLTRDGIQFDDAMAALDGLDANLVVFSTDLEKKFVDSMLAGDARFFVTPSDGDGGCYGPIVGYYQKASAKKGSDGWVTVTGEPTGKIPWDRTTGQPNEMDLVNAAAFAEYGGPRAPATTFIDMIRFKQVGTGFIAEFPPAAT